MDHVRCFLHSFNRHDACYGQWWAKFEHELGAWQQRREESFTNADLASVQCVISMELYDGRRYLCLCCMALLQTEVLKRKCHLLMPQQCVLGCG